METVKGMRDFGPEKKIFRDEVVETIKRIFELYGFNPIETPGLEKWEVLANKYAGGAEILKETYRLTDRGGRKLGLRYDLTVPLARFVSSRQFPKPFKRYQIGKVWRDGPTKVGRYREFVQCDVDVVGSDSLISDAEILAIARDVFKELGIDIIIKLNNRKLLNEMLEWAGVEKNRIEGAILSVDKLKKFGISYVENELKEKGIDKETIKKIRMLLNLKGIKEIKKMIGESEGIKELEQLLNYLKVFDVDVEIEISLARGLSYYTGSIYEIFPKVGSKSSIAAGGRYDKMISIFSGKNIPAVGISFGLDIIAEILKNRKRRKSVVQTYIIPVGGMEKEAIKLAQKLRKRGISTDIGIVKKSLSKNLGFANKFEIPFVLILGEKEWSKGNVTIRDMACGKEWKISTDKIIEFLLSKLYSSTTTPQALQ